MIAPHTYNSPPTRSHWHTSQAHACVWKTFLFSLLPHLPNTTPHLPNTIITL